MRQKVLYVKKKFFCLISRFFWGVSGVSHTATCAMNTTQNFKRVFLKTRFLKTARTITRTIFNSFFSNLNHIFQTTVWRETRTDFSISQFKQFLWTNDWPFFRPKMTFFLQTLANFTKNNIFTIPYVFL